MLYDSTTFQEEQIQYQIMERRENELSLTSLPRSVNIDEVCSKANLGKLAGDTFEMHGNLLFGC